MLATVSPSERHYEESSSTLRYAERAKRIVTRAVVNEDPNVVLIRQLREEIQQLRDLLSSGGGDINTLGKFYASLYAADLYSLDNVALPLPDRFLSSLTPSS